MPATAATADGTVAAVVRLVERAGWPLLADPLSGARHAENAIATYDLLLREAVTGAQLRPEMVVRVGDLPTSKPLRAWLASLADVRQLTIDPESAWQDPDAVVSERDSGDAIVALDALALDEPPDTSWLSAWRGADSAARAAIAGALGEELSEPLVAARLGEWLEPGTTLFCASSMPIRDLELYLPAGRPLPRIRSNRGANGIDGTVSSAFGVAAAGDGPVVLLIGDVALAHDLGGLLAARRLGLELTIVVLNNDGGGIFDFLPISGEPAAFEQHIATPHGLDFEHAAALYGLGYERPRTASELEAAVRRSIGSGATTLIEVATDRRQNLALHRRLAERALTALGREAD
jgi:2-succinyl-5-enolpyruvyl-6-hydroxy-3-cyclohexene-1-carboxylate synthase